MFLTAAAHFGFKVRKGDVKNAFLQGDEERELSTTLACEPVPELAKALNLEH